MNTSFLKRLALVLTGLLLWHASARAGLKVGDSFPEFAQFQLEGQPPDTQGKVILVDFWASWCGPCKASFPTLDELQKTYGSRGLVVIGISVDDKKGAMDAFLTKHPVSFKVLRDAAQKLVAAADVATMPTSFLIGADGKVRFLHSGFRGSETKSKYVKEIEALLTK